MGYNPIDPSKYSVPDVIAQLNNNLEYLYNKEPEKLPITSKNLIPYADFSLASNLEYWKPYKQSNLNIRDKKLNVINVSDVVGVISPVVTDTILAGTEYSLIIDATSQHEGLINEVYLVHSENDLELINFDKELNKGVQQALLKFDVDISNVRFIIGSADIGGMQELTFEYNDNLKDTKLWYDNKYLLPNYDFNLGSFDKSSIPLKQTLFYMLSHASKSVVDDEIVNIEALMLDGKVPTVYYPNKESFNRDVKTLFETFLLSEIYTLLYTQGNELYKDKALASLDFIGTLYNKSTNKGTFPILEGSLESSLLQSVVVHNILDIFIAKGGSITRPDLEGNNYTLDTIKESIELFITNNYKSIMDSDFAKLSIIDNKGALTFEYLDYYNQSSPVDVDIITQLSFCSLLVKMNRLDGATKILNSIIAQTDDNFKNDYIIPSIVKANGGYHTLASYSVAPTILIYQLLKKAPTILSNSNEICKRLLNTIIGFKSDNGLFKFDYNYNNENYSSNQFLETIIDGIPYTQARNVAFKTIALCAGKNVIPDNEDDIYNKIETEISRTEILVDENSILAIVSKKYVTKEFINGELSSIEEKLNEAFIQLSKESIIAKVIASTEWTNMANTVDGNTSNIKDLGDNQTVLLKKVNEQGSKIEANTNSITNKVWVTDIESAVSSIVSVGPNIIRNSNFIFKDFKYWDLSSSIGITNEQDSNGVTWAKVDSAIPIVLTQKSSDSMVIGSNTISLDAKGSGTVTITILNGADTIETINFEPNLVSARYNKSFALKSSIKPTIKITLQGTLQITKLKLSYGTIDIGWSLHPLDVPELANSLTDDVANLTDFINGAFSDGILDATEAKGLARMLDLFQKEKDQISSLTTILLNHKGVNGTSMATSLSNAYTNYVNTFNAIINYINSIVVDPSIYNKAQYDLLYNDYKTKFVVLHDIMQQANNQISNYEASNESSKVAETLKNEIKDVSGSITDLSDYLNGAFLDNVLTKEEKQNILAKLDILKKEKGDVGAKVEYYKKQPNLEGTAELTNLETVWVSYSGAISNIELQINLMIEATNITQDMRYKLNNLISIFNIESSKMEDALLKVNTKMSNSYASNLVQGAMDKIGQVEGALDNLNKYVDGAFKDDYLSRLEKSKIESDFEALNRIMIQLTSEIDYYETLVALENTEELNKLKENKLLMIQYFKDLKAFLDILLQKVTITPEDKTNFKNKYDLLENKLKDITVNIQDCSLKASSVTSGSDISGVLESIKNLGDKLNGVLDFTDSAWLDGVISYQEAVDMIGVMEQLDIESSNVVDEANTLIKNPKLANTSEKSDTEKALLSYNTFYKTLVDTINLITADSKVTADEKLKYKVAIANYKTSYINLSGKITALANKLVSIDLNSEISKVTDSINKQFGDVNGALNDIRDLSDSAFADTIISSQEKVAYKTLKDALYKEHLDIIKQLDVYLSATLTPEFVGQTILIDLNQKRTLLNQSYNTLEAKLDEIIKSNIGSPLDKKAYEDAKKVYDNNLLIVRELLLRSASLLAELKSSGNLNEFINGEFKSIVTRMEDAEFKLDPTRITAWVESTTTTLISQTYLQDNYSTTAQISNIYSTKTQLQLLQNEINLKATQESVNTAISKVTDRLTGLETSTLDIETRLSQAELSILPDAIIGVVGTQFYNKNEVNSNIKDAIDGIQIGGNNILLNTAIKYDLDYFKLDNSVTGNAKTTTNGNKCFAIDIIGKNDITNWGVSQSTRNIVNSNTYTFSAKIYVPTGHRIDDGINLTISKSTQGGGTLVKFKDIKVQAYQLDKWITYSITFDVPSDSVDIDCKVSIIKNGTIFVGDFMLEEGNKPTSWNPNPLDIVSDVDNSIVIGARNYAKKSSITPFSNPSNFISTKHSYIWEGNSITQGIKIDDSILINNSDMVMSFKFTKLLGDIAKIGGHCNHIIRAIVLDSVKLETKEWSKGIPIPNDTKEHYVVIFFKKGVTPTSDDSIYIQPNRGSTSASYKIQVSEIQVEKGTKVTDYKVPLEDIDSNFTDLESTLNTMERDLKEQLDGKIETWYQSNDPSTQWTTSELKSKHTGDIWQNTSNNTTNRWSGNAWSKLSDQDAINANELAKTKAKIFTEQPAPPYNKGDFWITSLTGSGIIKTCTTTRASGSYVSSDWVEGLKYIDQSKVDDSIKDIAIGGRNYVTKKKRYNNWEGLASPQDINPSNEVDCPNGVWLVGSEGNQSSARLHGIIDSNGWWTVSFYLRGTQGAVGGFYLDICDNGSRFIQTTADNQWRKIVLSVEVGNYSSDLYTFIDFNNLAWQHFFIKDLKVERGNKDTDWTPAPEDVTSDIDNIQVGGRNYVLKSNDIEAYTKDSIVSIVLGGGFINMTKNDSSTAYNAGAWIYAKVEPNTEYSLGVDIENYNNCLVGIGGSKNDINTWDKYGYHYPTKNGRFKHTFKTDALESKIVIFIGIKASMGSGSKVNFKDIKVEKGNKATDWTPAPEDVTNDINDKVNGIKVGGTNIVQNSAFELGDRGWNMSIATIDQDNEYNGHQSAKLVAPTGSETWYGITQNIDTPLIHGEDYTITCWFKVLDKTAINGYLAIEVKGFDSGGASASAIPMKGINSQDIPYNNTWYKIEYTGKVNSTYNKNPYVYLFLYKSGTVWFTDIKIEKGNKATEWSPNPNDYMNLIDTAKSSLTDIINSNTTTNNELWNKKLEDALEGYLATGEKDILIQYINSTVKQTDDSFNIVLNQFKGVITETVDGLVASKEELQTYYRFDIAGMILGKTGSPFTLRINNEKISFLQNGYEVAYMSNNSLVITDAYVKNSLRIGNFKWIPRSNGNLSFTWFNAVKVKSCSFNIVKADMATGKQLHLPVTLDPINPDDTSGAYASSNKDIAIVDYNGIVTAKALGTCNITYTTNDGGKVATCAINVNKVSITHLTISPELTLNVGATNTLTPTFEPSTATDKSVKWSVEDKSVLTVSNVGLVTGIKAGVTVITCTSNDGGYTSKCIARVTTPVSTS